MTECALLWNKSVFWRSLSADAVTKTLTDLCRNPFKLKVTFFFQLFGSQDYHRYNLILDYRLFNYVFNWLLPSFVLYSFATVYHYYLGLLGTCICVCNTIWQKKLYKNTLKKFRKIFPTKTLYSSTEKKKKKTDKIIIIMI